MPRFCVWAPGQLSPHTIQLLVVNGRQTEIHASMIEDGHRVNLLGGVRPLQYHLGVLPIHEIGTRSSHNLAHILARLFAPLSSDTDILIQCRRPESIVVSVASTVGLRAGYGWPPVNAVGRECDRKDLRLKESFIAAIRIGIAMVFENP